MTARKANTVNLVSRYNPVLEAERYINSLAGQGEINTESFIIIAGCINNYLKKAMIKYGIAEQSLICLYYCPEHCPQQEQKENSWVYGNIPLSEYLYHAIPLKRLKNLAVVDWKPSADAYPEIRSYISDQLKLFRNRHKANMHTIGKSGYLWLRNFMKNYLSAARLSFIKKIHGDVLLIAPGPSLERSIDTIKRIRKQYILVALASALRPLLLQDIVPDAVIWSDAGYWAGRMLEDLHSKQILCIQTAHSVPCSNPDKTLILPDLPCEAFLATEVQNRLPHIPDQGSVIHTALVYLLGSCTNRIFILGFDLEHPIDRAHCRHHLQDMIWNANQSRIKPTESQAIEFVLSRSISSSGATYRDFALEQFSAFFKQGSFESERLFRVEASTIQLPLNTISINELEKESTRSIQSIIDIEHRTVTHNEKKTYLERMRYFSKNMNYNQILRDSMELYLDTAASFGNKKNGNKTIVRELEKLIDYGYGFL